MMVYYFSLIVLNIANRMNSSFRRKKESDSEFSENILPTDSIPQ